MKKRNAIDALFAILSRNFYTVAATPSFFKKANVSSAYFLTWNQITYLVRYL